MAELRSDLTQRVYDAERLIKSSSRGQRDYPVNTYLFITIGDFSSESHRRSYRYLDAAQLGGEQSVGNFRGSIK